MSKRSMVLFLVFSIVTLGSNLCNAEGVVTSTSTSSGISGGGKVKYEKGAIGHNLHVEKATDKAPTAGPGGHRGGFGKLKEACGADMQSFCPKDKVKPGQGRIIDCLKANTSTSQTCKDFIATLPAKGAAQSTEESTQ